MAIWFECKVRYDKMQENGAVKKVNEPYLLDAITFTEAEKRIIEEITPYMSGEYSVSAVKKTKISEIFYNDHGDKYYMIKVAFVTIDEKSGKEKKSNTFILVQASNVQDALNVFNEGMKGTVTDFDVVSVTETPLMDVFPFNDKTKPVEE